MNKQKIEIKGKQLIYESQINAINDQTSKLQAALNEFKKKKEKEDKEYDKKKNDLTKAKNTLEAEYRQLNQAELLEMQENYKNKMSIEKSKEFANLGEERFKLNKKLAEDYKKEKEAEKMAVIAEREKAN